KSVKADNETIQSQKDRKVKGKAEVKDHKNAETDDEDVQFKSIGNGIPSERLISHVIVDPEDFGRGYTGPRRWSAPYYHPERGDRIIDVNGMPIQNTADFSEAIRNSDNDVFLTFIDNRTGSPYFMRTTLLPRGSRSRLGIFVRDDDEDGAVVTDVMANMPGNRCRYLQDGNVRPVRNQENVIRPVF
ncbi:MAG: hypothetical protein J6W10_06125, partial [Kiritimatiellae bacterium]|nr:hypothetical protein [Kiritimatiellia bacterium]